MALTCRWACRSQSFRINPFCLPPTPRQSQFPLHLYLGADPGRRQASSCPTRKNGISSSRSRCSTPLIPRLRTLSTLRNTLTGHPEGGLHKWTREGHFGFLFDNSEDTLTFSRFQCIEFEGMERYPQLIEPLLFYLLHRANAIIEDDRSSPGSLSPSSSTRPGSSSAMPPSRTTSSRPSRPGERRTPP